MATLIQKCRESIARRIARKYLFSLKERADAFEERERAHHSPAKSLGYYLQYAARQLDTHLLEYLLHTDDNGVERWFNQLPLTRVTLGMHGLEIRHTPDRRGRRGSHHLFVAPRSGVSSESDPNPTRRTEKAS